MEEPIEEPEEVEEEPEEEPEEEQEQVEEQEQEEAQQDDQNEAVEEQEAEIVTGLLAQANLNTFTAFDNSRPTSSGPGIYDSKKQALSPKLVYDLKLLDA